MRERHEHKHSHKDLSAMKNGCCANGICLGWLIFCIVPGMRLHFGLALNTELLTKELFCHLWTVLTQSQDLFCSVSHPPMRRLRGHSWAGWPQIWHCAWHIMLEEGEGRKQGTFRVMAFLFWSHSYAWWNPAVLGMAVCPWEVMNDFLVFFCLDVQILIHLLNCLYLNLYVFFFVLPVLFSIPLGNSEQEDR